MAVRDVSFIQVLVPIPGEPSAVTEQGTGCSPSPSVCCPRRVALHPAYIQGSEFTAFQLLFVSQMPIPQGALKITQWLIAFLKITACKVLCWGDWLLKLDALAGACACVCVCMHVCRVRVREFTPVPPTVCAFLFCGSFCCCWVSQRCDYPLTPRCPLPSSIPPQTGAVAALHCLVSCPEEQNF